MSKERIPRSQGSSPPASKTLQRLRGHDSSNNDFTTAAHKESSHVNRAKAGIYSKSPVPSVDAGSVVSMENKPGTNTSDGGAIVQDTYTAQETDDGSSDTEYLENGMATLWISSSPSPPTSGRDRTSAGDTEGEDDNSDDEQYRKNYHPLYIEYQENLGMQDNLYERRAFIMKDLDKLEDQRQKRQKVGLTLQKDDQNFLDSVPETLRQLDAKIHEYGVEIEDLRARCLEQGIIDEDDNYIDDDDSENSDDSTPLLPSLPLARDALPKPPAAIPPPPTIRIPIPAISPPVTASLLTSFTTSNLGARLDDQTCINHWLFEKSVASYDELALLATILAAMGAEPDDASLHDVIRLWEHDGAGMEPPQRPERLDRATLNDLRLKTWKVLGDGFDRALVRSLFGLSLWSEETADPNDE
ncbi:hypothetical protein O988_02869 [Pseudogymnoascus sp. VKM F-3808]|nr:hypothetical protein O988_02869 [Pseudogymnoascus sp. VKM F-3808]